MIDHQFGSTYIQSAIDLAVQAKQQLSTKPGVVSNRAEASRLFGLACKDMQAGIAELEGLKAEHPLAARAPGLVTEGQRRIADWEEQLTRLKEST